MSLKLAVDEASYGLKQVLVLFDCAPVNTTEMTNDVLSSPVTASSLSPMSSVFHGDAIWTSAVNTVQVCCTVKVMNLPSFICWLKVIEKVY